MNLNIKQKNIWILFVVFFGAALRFWKLGELPPSLNWDEVSHGYNAYSILKTGMDEWGVRLPLIFKAFVDYAWDEEINKVVGIGIDFEGYVFTTEDKKTKLVITDCFIEDHQDCIEFNKTRG